MKNRKLLLIIFSVLFVSISSFIFISKPSAQVGGKHKIELDEVPEVDLSKVDNENQERRRKNSKFNSSSVKKIKEDRRIKIITFMDTEVSFLPAIPIAVSDLVVIGNVRHSEAFLSDDKSNIYSEFAVIIDRVFINKQNIPLQQNGEIEVVSQGGRIRFPSGHAQTYVIDGQESLNKGLPYVLFLRKTDEQNIFKLLTAYKIIDGRVYPITDLVRHSRYARQTVEEFLNNLK